MDEYVCRYEEAIKDSHDLIDKSEAAIKRQSELNENQQDLIIWLQENKCETNDPLESISDLFIGGWSLLLVSWESCLSAAYKKLTNRQKAELVQEYLNQYLEQEDEQ